MNALATSSLDDLWAAYRASGARGCDLEDALVRAYLPLVKQVTDRIYAGLPRHVDYEDLIQAGRWGLLDAVRAYQPTRAAFRTYATTRVRSRILDTLRAADWLSRDKRHNVRAVQGAITVLEQTLSRTPSDQEIATHLGISAYDVRQAMTNHLVAHVASLDSLVPHGDTTSDPLGLSARTADHHVHSPDEVYEAQEDAQIVRQAIAALPDRYRHVLCYYYYEGLTLNHIGQIFGVTESRASQIRSKAVTVLQAHLSEQHMCAGVSV